jgi:Predicted pPIWI-associating nuclease
MQDKLKQELDERLQPFSAHLRTILRGAFASFADLENPLRFTNTGNALRELLREFLAEIAPDDRVKICKWFRPEPSYDGVTRRHRTMFAVYSYLDPTTFPGSFVTEVDDLAGEIVRYVEKLSAFTHVTKDILSKLEVEASTIFDNTVSLFLRLFEAIESAREHVRDTLESALAIDLAVLFTSEFFDDLDALSTHTRPQDAEEIRVKVTNIGDEIIEFSGTGSVLCDLQYGSDGDCRRGDGLEWTDSFPFTFIGHAETAEPHKPIVESSDIQIDTSKYDGDGIS